MQRQTIMVPSDPSRASVTLGDRLIFEKETISALIEGLFVYQFTCAGFAPQLKIPILGKLLGVGEAFLLRTRPVIASFQVGRTLPIAASTSLVDVHFIAKNLVGRHLSSSLRMSVQKCVTCVKCIMR